MNHQELKKIFKLFEHFTDEEIKNNSAVFSINQQTLNDLLAYKINKQNIYDILYLADYYQYINMPELIIAIQAKIFEKKINIDKEKLNNSNLYDTIYDGLCIIHKRTCELSPKFNADLMTDELNKLGFYSNLKHESCYNYLTKIKKQTHNDEGDLRIIDLCIPHNNLNLIKLLLKDGYTFSYKSILIAKKYKCNEIITFIKQIAESDDSAKYIKNLDD